ncbi:MAG TPA: hypothetical protein VKK79_16220, partial [Candidatus Lokiarchaeia archaeon]|nr:hypothetical protein [Candidatus Lokiarchaeia archaeon]
MHTSASLNFAQPPSLSAIYFNPAKNESTVYSFSLDHDANFSLNISAYYEPINLNKTFTLTYGDIGWYYNSSGTYFVVVNPGSVDPTVPQDLFLGIGKNASSLIWQDLGGVNATAGIAVCSRGPQIRIVYLEKNSTGVGSSPTWPVMWVKTLSSNDCGASWVQSTLWNCVSWGNHWFPGISIAANSTQFECAWGFSNISSSSSIGLNMSTIWETHNLVSGGDWSTPANLTS